MSEEYDFWEDRPLATKSFPIDGKGYTLREPSEEASRRFRNNNLRGAKVNDGKFSVSAENQANTQSELVGDCLFTDEEYGKGEKGKPVGVVWVRNHIPSKRAKGMFEWLKQVGGLNEADTVEGVDKQIEHLQQRREKLLGEPLKNSPSDSTESSE